MSYNYPAANNINLSPHWLLLLTYSSDELRNIYKFVTCSTESKEKPYKYNKP